MIEIEEMIRNAGSVETCTLTSNQLILTKRLTERLANYVPPRLQISIQLCYIAGVGMVSLEKP